jgi:hypothetical protein
MPNLFEGITSIHVYTRAEALADGVLIDVSDTAREAGFRIPVAVTVGVWEDCVAWEPADSARQTHQDQSGRLWDVVFMASHAARMKRGHDHQLTYELYRVKRGGKAKQATRVQLVLHIGPGDSGEPVLTIMLPGED